MKILLSIIIITVIALIFYWFLPEDDYINYKNIAHKKQNHKQTLQLNQHETDLSNTKPSKTKSADEETKMLSLKAIYQDDYFKAEQMKSIRWLKDGSGYTLLQDNADETLNIQEDLAAKDIVFYDPQTLNKKILVSAEELITKELVAKDKQKPLAIDDYIWSDDRSKLLIYTNSKKVWRSNSRGDYWLFDMSSRTLKQLGKTDWQPSHLMFAKFSSDGSKVAYVYENNIYVEHLNPTKIQQLTFDADEFIINGLFDWVYEEEFGIKDGFRWSANGENIAYWQLDTQGSRDFIMINNTDDIYPKLTRFPYPKVGETNAAARIGVVNLTNLKTTWMELPGNAREQYIPRMDWAENNTQLVIQQLNRKQDRNHVYLADINSGNAQVILIEQEETFIERVSDIQWIEQGKAFLWISERNGWRHVYRVSRDGKDLQDLTPGNFDVIKIEAVDEKNAYLYFIASPDDITQRYLYRASINQPQQQRVTPQQTTGTNNYQISPDGSWAIHSYSNFDTPEEKFLITLPEHKVLHQMLNNDELKEKLAKEQIANTEFFQVKARDGLVLDGYIMRPKDFDENKKYPVIFYVYGWPGGQTVKDVWRGDRYLWEQLMVSKGFLIISVDNRGTGVPKGRDWRKSIYGGVGIISSRDQYDALQAISKRWSYIDRQRIGVWGHSGGGSMTLDLLFRYSDSYHVGVSMAPVTDQKLYDTIYQERYSGLLADHAEGYKQGSAITHAKNLAGKLLLIHGTGDDNVHYQHAEVLINELVKHNKQFDFMAYPNRSHSISEGEGTSLHLRTMLTNYFLEHLSGK